MNKTRKIIEENNSIFGDHLVVVKQIEDYAEEDPDIAIGCCKSLFEGVGKTILESNNTSGTASKFFKDAVKQIEGFEINEATILRQLETIINNISTIRDQRDPLSHGRASPRTEKSSPELAEFVIAITDYTIYYTIYKYVASLDSILELELQYFDNPEFNDYLDEEFYQKLNEVEFDIGRVEYSEALFNQDPVSYKEQLENYKELD